MGILYDELRSAGEVRALYSRLPKLEQANILLSVEETGGKVMPSGFERQALLFHVQAIGSPKGAPILPLKAIAKILEGEWRAGRAITRLEELEAEDLDAETLEAAKKRHANAVYIQDMNVTSSGCEILLTLGDAAESDPAIVSFRTRGVRYVRKGTDGGVGFSAHLSLSFSPSAPPVQYRAVLERMPGLGRNTVINYINRILRKHAKGNGEFRFVEQATGKDKAYRPRIISASQPSRALKAALSSGRLTEVTLVQRTHLEGEIDQAERFRVEEKRLKISAETIPLGADGRRGWLNALKDWAKRNSFEEVQVRLRPNDGSSYMSSRFSTEIADAADAIYSKHEQIYFTSEVAQCHTALVRDIADPLTAMLRKDALWR